MEHALEDILASISEGVILQEAGGAIRLWNRRAEEIFGVRSEDALGQKSSSRNWRLLHEDGSPCPPDLHPSMITLATGEPMSEEVRGILRPDGSVTWVSINTRPMFEEGRATPAAVVISFREVTEQLHALRRLERSEHRLSTALEAAGVGLWDLDLRDRSLDVSRTWWTMLGYAPGELPASYETWTALLHPEDRERVTARASETIERGREDYEQVFRMRTRSGGYRWIQSTGRVTRRDEAGKPAQMLGTHADVTSLMEAEQDLKRIAWLLRAGENGRDGGAPPAWPDRRPYGDLAELNRDGLIRTTLEPELLVEVAGDYLALLDTSAAIYERDGAYALGIFSSGWCRALDAASYRLCGASGPAEALASGRWLCHESCWHGCSEQAIETGSPVDAPCHGGLRIYSVPVWAGGEVIGAINFGYGDPPTDPGRIAQIAEAYRLDPDELLERARAYEPRPPFIVEMAKRRIETSAALLGALVESRTASRKLQESEARNRTILESAMDGFLLVDQAGRLLEVNDAYCRMSGYTREELLTMSLPDIEAEEDPAETAAHMDRVVARGEDRFESRHRRKDGSTFDIEASVQHHGFEGGRMVAFIRDVSERKRDEEALRDANERLEALWTASSMLDAGIQEISDHVLRSLTRMTRSRYGFYGFLDEAESVMSIHAWGGRAMVDCAVASKPLEFAIEDAGVWAEAVRRRAPLVLNDYDKAHPGKKGLPSGHVPLTNLLVVPHFVQGRIVSLAAVANRDAPYGQDDVAQVHSFLNSVQAVVDRRRAKDALAASEARLNLALESVSDGVWDWRPETGEAYFSPRYYTMLGYEPGELPPAYATWRRLVHPDDLPGTEARIARHLISGDPFEVEFRMRAKDGGWRWILGRGKTVERDATGKPVRMLGTHVDLTHRRQVEQEQKELESRLQQGQKMEALGTLASGIAHDFNNVLGIIIGYADLLSLDLAGRRDEAASVREILHAAGRAKDLIRQILTFSRKTETQRARLDLNACVREAANLFRRTLPKMIEVRLDLQEGLAPVAGDEQQLEQMLINLANNAVDAMPDGGTLTLATACRQCRDQPCPSCGQVLSGAYLVLEVSDNGQGIGPGELKRVFDPFYTTKEIGKGTGLGLSMVYGIVTGHGGHITCESLPGRGTTFTIHLPACVAAETSDAAPVRGPAVPTHGSETILVVDDEQALREMVEQTLTREGYGVLQARTGEEALACCREHGAGIDVVLLDLGMPGMGGRRCLPELSRVCPGARVIVGSGYLQCEEGTALREMGAARVIGKPYLREELLRSIRQVLDA